MSEQVKHTPGPWKISDMLAIDNMLVRDGSVAWVHNSRRMEAASGALIGEVTSDSWIEGGNSGLPIVKDRAEMLANAALIAAAPETAAERDRLRAVNADLLEALRKCVELIRHVGNRGIYIGELGGAIMSAAAAAIAKAEGAE